MVSKRRVGVVGRYYAYMMTLAQGFITPVLVVVMLQRGLSYTEIGIASAAFRAAWVAGEVPSRYLGDRVGRRASLLVSTGLNASAIVAFGLGHSFLTFVAAYTVWGLGVTFRSGSLGAWLYDSLSERLDEDQYTRVTGRGGTVVLAVTAVQSVVSGYLYNVDSRYPFLLNGVLVATGAVILLTFPSSQGGDADDPLGMQEAVYVIRDRLSSSPLRSFVLYAALFYAALEAGGTLVQPVSLSLGFDETYIGWLYAGLTGVGAVASYVAGDVEERIGIRHWFNATPLLVGGAFLTTLVVPILALPAFAFMRAANRITGPLRSQFVNDVIDTTGRSTVLSAVSMVNSVVTILFTVGVGVLADAIGPVRAFAALGAVLTVGTLALRGIGEPVPSVTK